jgi:hypothetical protein
MLLSSPRTRVLLRLSGVTAKRAVAPCVLFVCSGGVTAADAEKPCGCLVGVKAIDRSTVDCENCPACVVGLPATRNDLLIMSMILHPDEKTLDVVLAISRCRWTLVSISSQSVVPLWPSVCQLDCFAKGSLHARLLTLVQRLKYSSIESAPVCNTCRRMCGSKP